MQCSSCRHRAPGCRSSDKAKEKAMVAEARQQDEVRLLHDNRPSQPIAVSLLCLRFILWPMCRLCVRVCVLLLCASLLHAVYPPPPLPVTACPYRTANSALHPPPPDPALCSLSCVRMGGWSHPSNSAPPVLIFPLPTRTRACRRLPDEVQQQRRLQ